MIALIPALAALALAASAGAVGRASSAATARTLATRLVASVTAGSALLAAVAAWDGFAAAPAALTLLPAATPRLAPLIFNLIALAAVALAPLRSHPPRTLARVLRIIAAAQLCTSCDLPPVVAAGWGAAAWITWRELSERAECAGAARLFAASHVASTAAIVLAMALAASGNRESAAVFAVLAIAVRAGLAPGHGWLVLLVERAPLAIAVAFLAPQLAAWAYLNRFAELASGLPATLLGTAAAFTALTAAGLGMVQVEARRALAFLILSQSSLVLLGASAGSATARVGAIVTWDSLALAVAGLAMTFAAAEARRGQLMLVRAGEGVSGTPRLATAMLLFGLAVVGFPLSLGFIGEDLLIEGAAFPVHRLITISAAALNGITALRAYLYLFSGAVTAGEQDLRRRESVAAAVLLVTLLIGGVAPRLFVSVTTETEHIEAAGDVGRPPAIAPAR